MLLKYKDRRFIFGRFRFFEISINFVTWLYLYFWKIMNFLLNPQIRRIFCLMVRQNFSKECEDALNKQINMELKACHAYLAMARYFFKYYFSHEK